MAQMPLAKDDDMIKTFASGGADQPFAMSILPGRSRCWTLPRICGYLSTLGEQEIGVEIVTSSDFGDRCPVLSRLSSTIRRFSSRVHERRLRSRGAKSSSSPTDIKDGVHHQLVDTIIVPLSDSYLQHRVQSQAAAGEGIHGVPRTRC